jgi:hypothetical protein
VPPLIFPIAVPSQAELQVMLVEAMVKVAAGGSVIVTEFENLQPNASVMV